MNTEYKKSDGTISEEELQSLLEEVKATPPEPVLTPEQQKKMNVFQAGRLFRGGLGKVGTSKIGVTRANKKLSKKAVKTAKNSRKISRGKS
jgi:hypothetical protein